MLLQTVAALVLLLAMVPERRATDSNINAENCRSRFDIYNRTFRLQDGALRSTVLQYAMDTAINRAIFYSLIYNWTDLDYSNHWTGNALQDYDRQPGLNYIYMSTAANVHAGPPGIMASGLFFDRHSAYPNWLRDVAFNMTLPLFGIRADNNMIKDFGSTPESNYTNSSVYPQNQFYRDLRASNSGLHRQTYVMILHKTNQPLEQRQFSVNTVNGNTGHLTPPYFDCGQSNQWMMDTVSMVTELMVRNSLWMHLRYIKSVAASTVSVSMETLDGSNMFTSARATLTPARYVEGHNKLSEQDVTICSNLLAPNPPVRLADDFWRADDLALTLEAQGRAGLRLSHFLSNFLQNNDFSENQRNLQIITDAYNAWMYGAISERPTFDSPMIEVKIDQGLTYKQLASEAFATLMSGGDILSVGIFLDTGVFPNSTSPVSAFAWKGVSGYGQHVGNVVDLFEEAQDFTAEQWFTQAKQNFAQVTATNTQTFSTGRQVRVTRTHAPRPTPTPVTYTATSYDQGTWLPPHFLCGPRQAGWSASYVSPIFVPESDGLGIQFGGVVKIDATFTANNISPS